MVVRVNRGRRIGNGLGWKGDLRWSGSGSITTCETLKYKLVNPLKQEDL